MARIAPLLMRSLVEPVDDGMPAWLEGQPLHQWVEISGTSGAGGAGGTATNPYSGFCVTPSGDIIFAAAGGHNDSADNSVTRCRLSADSPSWAQLCAPSSVGSIISDAAYYADGKPSSRHVYVAIFYVASLDRVFLVGCHYAYGGVTQRATVDAYHVGGGAWDPAGTWADIPGTPYLGVVQDGAGHIWTTGSSGDGMRRFDPATNTWSNPISTRAASTPAGPWAYDSLRNQRFGIQYSSGLRASKVSGTTETAITINSSAALTQWLADTPLDGGMGYDPDNDRFLYYSGVGSSVGRVYAITPNSGAVWDMSILSLTGTPPPATHTPGEMNGKFRAVSFGSVKGFVALPDLRTSNLHFFRTA